MLCRGFSAFLRYWSLSCSSEGCQATTALRIEQDFMYVLVLLPFWYFAPSTPRIAWRLDSARYWRLASIETGADNPGSRMSISDEWGHIDSEQIKSKSNHSWKVECGYHQWLSEKSIQSYKKQAQRSGSLVRQGVLYSQHQVIGGNREWIWRVACKWFLWVVMQ